MKRISHLFATGCFPCPNPSRRTASARHARPFRGSLPVTEPLEVRRLMVSDDFNDGDDADWTHDAPLEDLGAPGTYEVTNGTYRITAAASPDPNQLGPGRAGAFRNDASFSDFAASIDLVDWDTSLDQAFGILARVTSPGLGTTNGYALSYSPSGGALDISKVTGEVPDDLDPGTTVFLDPARDYRLVFEGRGDQLTGRIFDLNDLTRPLLTTHATDATYASGITGLFVYDNSSAGTSTADAAFDNFVADVPGPADPTIAYWRFEEGQPGDKFTATDRAVDEAGFDDPLRTLDDSTGPVYTSDNAGLVFRFGHSSLQNTLSLDFTPNQDVYTAQPGDLDQHRFNQFTVEASFNLDTNDASQCIVGKDGKPLLDSPLAPLQLRHRMDNHHLQIEMLDAGGNPHQVQSIDPIAPGHWYHAAAVCDGRTLELYLEDATNPHGYALQGSVDVSGGLIQTDATWDVGRGFFDGSATDWTDGKIDEVRISDVALGPSQFLFVGGIGFETRVTSVFVNGPNLTNNAAWRRAAGADATFGYAIPDGANQLRPIPWNQGVNQVSLRFDSDVAGTLDQADLVVTGSAGPMTTTGFTYDEPAHVGTWTLPATVTLDKLRLVLRAAGVFVLDGEWTNPSGIAPNGDLFPSGDGVAGGDFRFRINVLRGDATGDQVVNALDLADVKKRLTRRPGDGVTGSNAYSIFADFNADGVVNAFDVASVKSRLGMRLSSLPDPATALLFA